MTSRPLRSRRPGAEGPVLGGASGTNSRDQRTTLVGYCPATDADRRAHFRKSLGGLLAVLAGFYATLALLIALITVVGA